MKKISFMILMLLSMLGCDGYVFRGKYTRYVWIVFDNGKARSLAIAAARGDVEKIRKLHQEGADLNYRGAEGITPLLWALSFGNKAGFE